MSGILGSHIAGMDVSGFASIPLALEFPMPEKVLFLSTYLSDKGTVVGSSQIASLPAKNVLDQEPSKVWRTATNIGQYLDINLPSVVAVNAAAVCWPYGTLSQGALGRLQLFASLADRNDNVAAKDTGLVSMWPGPAGYKHSDPEWGPEVGLLRIDNDEAYRYLRLWLTDPGAPQAYLDVGRVAFGRSVQFRINPRMDGGIGFVPIDVQEPNGYGQVFTDPRPYQQRQFELVWSALAELEATEDAMELTRLRGQSGDLFVFMSPSDVSGFHRKSMQAIFEGQQRFTPTPTWVIDKDGESRMGWGFTITMTQKL